MLEMLKQRLNLTCPDTDMMIMDKMQVENKLIHVTTNLYS